jgi:AraC family transcriptional regulator
MEFPGSIINHRIEEIKPKKLAGLKIVMTIANDQTFKLWSTFMPIRKNIPYPVGKELYSVKIYDPAYFTGYFPDREFEKWAAVEVEGFACIPPEFRTLTLPGGKYAVFRYRGTSADAGEAFRFIYLDWIGKSGYILDDRPHFDLLGEKYKKDDPGSEEDIYIPVKIV